MKSILHRLSFAGRVSAGAVVLLMGVLPAHADKVVYVDINFVAVQTPGSGIFHGPGLYFLNVEYNNDLADAFLTQINNVMVNSGRGLLYRRLGDIQYKTLSLGDSDANGTDDIDQINSANFGKNFHGTFVTNAAKPENQTAYAYDDIAVNFYLIPSLDFGLGFDPLNAVMQGGFSTDPGTHELGHWFTLPHTFRVGSGPPVGVTYWADQDSPAEHGDGFTDTLIDHINGVPSLDDGAAFKYPSGDGSAVTYAGLAPFQQTFVREWFQNHYAKQFFNAASYSALTAAQKTRIPPYDTAAPAPVATDRELLAIHVHGRAFDLLTATEQAPILAAVSSPNAPYLGKTSRFWVWYFKTDDDLLARHDFGKFYDELNGGEREQIRLLHANIMSYRGGKGSVYGIFSEQQLDRMCDVISQATAGRDRSLTRSDKSGKYIFFGGPMTLASAPLGSSLRAHASLTAAHTAVTVHAHPLFPDKKDVILGRPGNYPVPGPNGTSLRLNKPCVIRATNAGPVSITGH